MQPQAPTALRLLRTVRGTSQTDLAAFCGISAATLSQIETGRLVGSPDLLARLAAGLHCEARAFRPGPIPQEVLEQLVSLVEAGCRDHERAITPGLDPVLVPSAKGDEL